MNPSRPDCVPQWESLAPAAYRGSYLPMLSRLSISAMLPVPILVLHWMGFMAFVTITLTGIRPNSAASAGSAYGAPAI
jgi:hypothetical protein